MIPFALVGYEEMILASEAFSVEFATNSYSTRTRGIIVKYLKPFVDRYISCPNVECLIKLVHIFT